MRELQRQCSEYVAPADQIVYDDDPQLISQHIQSDPGLTASRFNLEPRGRTYAVRRIEPLIQLCNLPDRFPIPVFLHGRRCGNRDTRMAFVLLARREESAASPTIWMDSCTVRPITPWSNPALELRRHALRIEGLPNTAPIRFYAGQPDREHADRLSIAFEANGERGVIVGNVEPDGTIRLRVASGPGVISN